jgi:hypothetical protein
VSVAGAAVGRTDRAVDGGELWISVESIAENDLGTPAEGAGKASPLGIA